MTEEIIIAGFGGQGVLSITHGPSVRYPISALLPMSRSGADTESMERPMRSISANTTGILPTMEYSTHSLDALTGRSITGRSRI